MGNLLEHFRGSKQACSLIVKAPTFCDKSLILHYVPSLSWSFATVVPARRIGPGKLPRFGASAFLEICILQYPPVSRRIQDSATTPVVKQDGFDGLYHSSICRYGELFLLQLTSSASH